MLNKFAVIAALSAALTGAGGCHMFPSHEGEVPGQVNVPRQMFSVDFSACQSDRLPPGFISAMTGGGASPSWKVIAVPGAAGGAGNAAGKKVLAQTIADPSDVRCPLCICSSVMARNLVESVRFRAVSGKADASGGLVVRYRDANNYYLVRANALGDYVRFYKVQNGKRLPLGGIDVKVAPLAWHTLSLRAHGDQFTITFDDKSFEAHDATFPGPGQAGLWTRADSIIWFDDLTIETYDGK